MENPYLGLFYVNEATLYVPDESVDTYRKAEGWKRFKKIRGLSEFNPNPVNMTSLNTSFSVKDAGDCYIFSTPIDMEQIKLYSVSGQLLFSMPVHAKQGRINKFTLPSPYAIASIDFADGTTQTFKLIP